MRRVLFTIVASAALVALYRPARSREITTITTTAGITTVTRRWWFVRRRLVNE
jgi:hypothetical protein